jgi:uncharacterized RDD family membrane protein YckC
MQNPPPPPPPPMTPPGQPPMMPPGGGPTGGPGNLASPGLRIVGGLIDVVILAVVVGVAETITRGSHGLSGVLGLIIALVYLAYFWNTRGQSIGMMVFNFKVRDAATGQYPDVVRAIVRAFFWWIEVVLTPLCLIGAIGWGWQVWDRQHQALHDKAAGTIVTVG